MLYSGCLPTALAENKGDDVPGSLRETKWAAQNHGFYWPGDHLGTKAEWSLSQSFKNCGGGAGGGKVASFPSPAAARLDSMLCLWVLHGPWPWSPVLWAVGGEPPMPSPSRVLSRRSFQSDYWCQRPNSWWAWGENKLGTGYRPSTWRS